MIPCTPDPQAAETGSGKTGAFAIPAIQIVHETRRTAAAAAAAAAEAAAKGAAASSDAPLAKKARLECSMLDTEDRSPMLAIAPDGLTCQCRLERDWGGVRATRGVLRGRAYFEAEIRDEGLCRFGWSTKAASLDLGTDKHGFGFGGTGKKSNDRKFDTYGEAFGKGDVIGCYADIRDAGDASVSFSKNGQPLGVAFEVPRLTGALFPTICMKNAECGVSFGSGSAFKFAPVDGFVGLDALPSSAVAVADAAPAGKAGAASSKADAAPNGGPVCLIIEPARDLAEQTAKAVEMLAKYVFSPPVTHSLIIGGVDNKENMRAVARRPDIVTATAGKLLDLVESGKLSLGSVRLLVLDEADRFTDVESFTMVMKIHGKITESAKKLGTPGRLQVAFFSATLHSPEIGKLSDALCTNPTWVDLKGKDSVPDTVHHVIIRVDPEEDRAWCAGAAQPSPSSASASSADAAGTAAGAAAGAASVAYGAASSGGSGVAVQPLWTVPTDGIHALTKLNLSGRSPSAPLTPEQRSEGIKRLKPAYLVSLIDSLAMDQCLIFCRTNVDCDNLEAYLQSVGGGSKFKRGMEKGKENPYSCVVLAGMRSMDDRRKNLDAFREGDVRFLICTDVAARGLDIKELPYVVNMTLPDEAENYIHRIGRVGRADRMGLAISLVATAPEQVWYHKCAARGKGCANTKLIDAGGCTMQYNEPALLAGIQKRLQMGAEAIPTMSVTRNGSAAPGGPVLPYAFSLPPSIASLGAVYGGERGDAPTTSAHVETIRSQVQTLAGMEVRAQTGFLALQIKYAKFAPSAVAAAAAAAASSSSAMAL